MRFPWLSLLLLSLPQHADAATRTSSLNGWYPCSAVTFEEQLPPSEDPTKPVELPGAQCGTFKAPLCHEGVCEDPKGQEIEIFVKRISSGARTDPNVIFLQGGPGAASPAMESAMLTISALLGKRVNVYTLDHRGTGRSNKLECVAAQALMSASPGGASVDVSEVASCATELEERYGKDLAAFSVTSAATDVQYFVSNFLQDSRTFVYGVSYGTSLVERLMHLETPEIAGYILDGISTTSGSNVKNFEYFSMWDPDFDEIGQYFLSFCAKNEADCGKYFSGSTAAGALKTLLTTLEDKTSACYDPLDKILSRTFGYQAGTEPPGHVLRQLLGKLLRDADNRPFIPVLTYRLARCTADDQQVVRHFFEMLAASMNEKSEETWFTSDLLYKLIIYSEFWEKPAPSEKDMIARFLNTSLSSGMYSEAKTYCAFTKDNSSSCAEVGKAAQYEASPIMYKKDKYWNVAAKPPKDMSVLLMSGKMDPQTPHKYAEYLFDAIKTTNKELITFETATHGTLWSTLSAADPDGLPCGMRVVASYIINNGDLQSMDKSCVAALPPVSFQLEPTTVSAFLNATAPYDGTFTGVFRNLDEPPASATGATSSSSTGKKSYKTVFIVFVVLFALAAVVTIVFALKWHRAKKAAALQMQVYQESTV